MLDDPFETPEDGSPPPSSPIEWERILLRASGLRRRYQGVPDAPQSTWSLVNRAALRLGGDPRLQAKDDEHLYALWAKAMGSVLTDLCRRPRLRVSVTPEDAGALAPCAEPTDEMHQLHDALEELSRVDAQAGGRKAMIIALRYFEGEPWKEIARLLGCSVSSAQRELRFALPWLRRALKTRGVDLP